ncbi:hypothetical protein L6164_007727 [Bauhinia variegata]|uniref:Uncharacterized protein n=2 Tax=Bauhinia variegata TaxID=167791 RepID=A0ACB9PDF5_BAUVA|nr:hypothetical protein L6164_007723 [Bauhinia variegata]KAI4346863.1 hypothetical protein L6164_007727 [Bauhinia variegata]
MRPPTATATIRRQTESTGGSADREHNLIVKNIGTLLINNGLINGGTLRNDGVINLTELLQGNYNGSMIISNRGGDKLILRELKFHGFHGKKHTEKKLFSVDVDACMDLRAAGESDLSTNTVTHTSIYRIVKKVVEGPHRDLLECLAEQIAIRTMGKHPQISAVRVQVGKTNNVEVADSGYYLGVEIFRDRRNVSS